jgi:hypothetical protein
MSVIQRGMLGVLILAALFMKAPLWDLPVRISDHLGIAGDSWHRSHLMEMAAKDVGKWWLWGMSRAETVDWFPYNLPQIFGGGADITNQFLSFGLTGGLLATILFIWLLVKCFKSLGEAMETVRSAFPKPAETEFLLWGLGLVLVVHIENWFAITYFDQTYVIWFMQLAAIVNISQKCLQSSWREREKWLMLSVQRFSQVRQG